MFKRFRGIFGGHEEDGPEQHLQGGQRRRRRRRKRRQAPLDSGVAAALVNSISGAMDSGAVQAAIEAEHLKQQQHRRVREKAGHPRPGQDGTPLLQRTAAAPLSTPGPLAHDNSSKATVRSPEFPKDDDDDNAKHLTERLLVSGNENYSSGGLRRDEDPSAGPCSSMVVTVMDPGLRRPNHLSVKDSVVEGARRRDGAGWDQEAAGPLPGAVKGVVSSSSSIGSDGASEASVEEDDDEESASSSSSSPSPSSRGGSSLGALLHRELKGRHLFSFEPHHDFREPPSKDRHQDQHQHQEQRRIVSKKGLVHTERVRVSKRGRRYLSDFFNTMLDMKWRYVLLIFTLSFVLSWLAFAYIWWVMMYLRGDFEPDHLPGRQAESGWVPCVLAIHNFASVYLFSVETQHTIGYGSRQTTEKCPEAIFFQSFQSVVGVMIQACMVGTVFAKLSRPKRRAQTLMFTKNAVVCLRDGRPCLLFRVGNMRYSHLVEAHVSAYYVARRVTREGEVLTHYQTDLKVGVDLEGREDSMLFLWPSTVVHVIDEESPFYDMGADDLLRKRYEVVVVLEGIVEPTGMSIQARSSYVPNEILWGYRFLNLLSYRKATNLYKVDYSSFNMVYKVSMPRCSAREQCEAAEAAAAAAEGAKVDEGQDDKGDVRDDDDEVDTRHRWNATNFPLKMKNSSNSMILSRAAFFGSSSSSTHLVPYHQSQAALLPPYAPAVHQYPPPQASGGFRGGGGGTAASTTRPGSSTLLQSNSNHVKSMPCLQGTPETATAAGAAVAGSQTSLKAAYSVHYKKALNMRPDQQDRCGLRGGAASGPGSTLTEIGPDHEKRPRQP